MSDQLRHRIQQWEASPPPAAWANIAVAIKDIAAENELAVRLQDYEAAPPPESWQAIRQEISIPAVQPASKTPVIPIQPLYPYLFRYGAVAIAIALVAWVLLGNPYWKDNPVNTNDSQAVVEPPKSKPVDSNINIATAITGNSKAVELPAEPAVVSNNLPSRDPQYARIHPVDHKRLVGTKPSSQMATLKAPPATMHELPVQKRNQRYITVYSSSGEPLKLSAKFAPLYYSMVQDSEKSGAGLLLHMQQQMLRYPYTPDPNNHFDMIRLVDLLQQ